MDGITWETYGLIFYQEQVIRIATELAGFTAIEAGRFRRALRMRGREDFRDDRPGLLAGCASRGVADADARRVWDLLEGAEDVFLKAYLLPDAFAAYRAAYVKLRWPRALFPGRERRDGPMRRAAVDSSTPPATASTRE